MRFIGVEHATTFLLLTTFATAVNGQANLTCYQCEKNENAECSFEELLPCPPVSDRCVTTISKNAQSGFTIKRECGLGPCGFDDDMVNRGLGFGSCDRSRDEYFCILCCKRSGCNRNVSVSNTSSKLLLIFVHILICIFVKISQ